MKQTLIVGTDLILFCAKNLMLRGEITEEQYNKMAERNNQLSENVRKNIKIVRG